MDEVPNNPNHPITQPPNHPASQSPNHPATKSPQSPNHPATQPPNNPFRKIRQSFLKFSFYNTMYNQICHIEFEAKDLDQAQAFYESLFGWQFAEFPVPGMKIFGYDDKHIGGLMQSDAPKPGNSPSLWFKVQDLDSMVAKAQELGGSLIAARSEVPHVGWSACIGDLDGNPVGLVQYREEV